MGVNGLAVLGGLRLKENKEDWDVEREQQEKPRQSVGRGEAERVDRYGSDVMQPVKRGEDKARNCAKRLANRYSKGAREVGTGKSGKGKSFSFASWSYCRKYSSQRLGIACLILMFGC